MLGIFLSQSASVDVPKWPKKYHVKGTWSIPYAQIREPFYAVTDEVKKRQADIVYNGIATNALFVGESTYKIQASPDGYTCSYTEWKDLKKKPEIVHYLPDLADWTYMDKKVILGRLCDFWRKDGEINDYYEEFYTDNITHFPVRYYQKGPSIRNSHPAVYILDFEEYGPTIDESVFIMPSNCKNSNSTGPTIKSGPREKLQATVQGMCELFDPPQIDLPVEFSYRNFTNSYIYNNVKESWTKPRDQGNCGSCWAVSAAAAISAQLGLRYKGFIKVSTQQILDCTWDEKYNQGCVDGEGFAAYHHLAEKGIPLASEEEYPYIGVSGFCQTKVMKPVGIVTGCKQIIPNNPEAIKRALYAYGPLQVYMIAGLDSWTNYKGGVFNDPTCKLPDHKLDHGVLLTGFKTIDGVPCFEFMNSWSDVWGDNGFGYVPINGADCGITEVVLLPSVKYYKDLPERDPEVFL